MCGNVMRCGLDKVLGLFHLSLGLCCICVHVNPSLGPLSLLVQCVMMFTLLSSSQLTAQPMMCVRTDRDYLLDAAACNEHDCGKRQTHRICVGSHHYQVPEELFLCYNLIRQL